MNLKYSRYMAESRHFWNCKFSCLHCRLKRLNTIVVENVLLIKGVKPQWCHIVKSPKNFALSKTCIYVLPSYYVCDCWKDDFLASFDVRMAHAGTSVVFSYLVFRHFNFCLRKFKGLITLKNTVLKNAAPFLHAKFIYLSINATKITFCLFYKNLFSILNFIASGRFRTASTSETELFCDSS